MLLSYYHTYQEAGTDEAGRGCLAGPVTASAVILPPDFKHPLLNDSKQLSEAKRSLLRPIIEKEALSFSVCHILPEKIDEINILNASILAMHNSLKKLSFAQNLSLWTATDSNPFLIFRINAS